MNPRDSKKPALLSKLRRGVAVLPPRPSGKNPDQPPYPPWGEAGCEPPSGREPGRWSTTERYQPEGTGLIPEGGGGLAGNPPAGSVPALIVAAIGFLLDGGAGTLKTMNPTQGHLTRAGHLFWRRRLSRLQDRPYQAPLRESPFRTNPNVLLTLLHIIRQPVFMARKLQDETIPVLEWNLS